MFFKIGVAKLLSNLTRKKLEFVRKTLLKNTTHTIFNGMPKAWRRGIACASQRDGSGIDAIAAIRTDSPASEEQAGGHKK